MTAPWNLTIWLRMRTALSCLFCFAKQVAQTPSGGRELSWEFWGLDCPHPRLPSSIPPVLAALCRIGPFLLPLKKREKTFEKWPDAQSGLNFLMTQLADQYPFL